MTEPTPLIMDDKIVPIFGDPDASAVVQMEICMKDEEAIAGAVMADHHKGYSMPIGGVIAYYNAVSPSGVGYDIACGNKAVRISLQRSDLQPRIKDIMDEIYDVIPFGVGRVQKYPEDHILFDSPLWNQLEEITHLKELAYKQLGTIGAGNHFIDIFYDSQDRIWIGVHFGSRGFGHKVATGYMNLTKGRAFGDKPPHEDMNCRATILSLDEELGIRYWNAMRLAGTYAYAGRDHVCQQVAKILGGEIEEEVHNHHNFAWVEEHRGEQLVVVRKGATPAAPGQRGFIGSTMAEPSVIIEGVESEASASALYSTVHGAGRSMSRVRAKGKWKKRDGQYVQVKEGVIKWEDMWVQVREADVELRGGWLDEAPECYKRLPEVLAAHEGTIKVIETLCPMGVAMAVPRR